MNYFSNPSTAPSLNSSQPEISSNPISILRSEELFVNWPSEMPELDKPPSYIDVENQDIPPTYEEAKLNELLQYMKYSYNIID